MAQDTRANVKTLFEQGDKPDELQFITTWDSIVFWLDDVLDEDDMVSDSEDHLATQQSIKAFVEAQVGPGIQTIEAVLQTGNNTGSEDLIMGVGGEILFTASATG